jgi:hypothetical protein
MALQREGNSQGVTIKARQSFWLRGVDDKAGEMEGLHRIWDGEE